MSSQFIPDAEDDEGKSKLDFLNDPETGKRFPKQKISTMYNKNEFTPAQKQLIEKFKILEASKDQLNGKAGVSTEV